MVIFRRATADFFRLRFGLLINQEALSSRFRENIMIGKMKNLEIKNLIFAVLITYIPFHLLEEALFDFPLWLAKHYGIVQLSYSHWLINNLIFLLFLLTGFFIYNRNKEKFQFLGLGIIAWGFINSIEHIVFTFIDKKAAPGLFTSLIFLAISISALYKLKEEQKLKTKIIMLSLFVGLVVYFVLPMIVIAIVGQKLIEIFK